MEQYLISEDAVVLDAINAFKNENCRCLFVIAKNKVIGCLSEGDLIRGVISKRVLGCEKVTTMMTLNYAFLHCDDVDLSRNAREIFLKSRISAIPVLDQHGFLKSVITPYDLL